MLSQGTASTLSLKYCLFRSTMTSSLWDLMVNFLLHNCLIRWFWSILLLVATLSSASRPLLALSWSSFLLPLHLLSLFCLLLLCLPFQSWHLQDLAFDYSLSCIPTVITSNPLVSVFTSIHCSITYIIIMASNIYWEFTIMCQAVC